MGIAVILFLLGLVLLYFGGDVFVDSAVSLARRFRVSEMLIGATIVSIGTTLPEMTVSALASAGESHGVAYGNAVGSVICNASLIGGVLLLPAKINVEKTELRRSAKFFFGSILLMFLFRPSLVR